MKSRKLHKFLIHIYMFISVLGFVLTISAGTLSEVLLTVGASSWLIAIGVSSAGTANWIVGAFLLLWGISFPILLLVFYIIACRKRPIPFVVITVIDAVIVLLWTISCLTTDDLFAFKQAVPDAVVSVLYTTILISCVSLRRKVGSAVP